MKKYPQSRNQKLFDELINSDLYELVRDKRFSDVSLFISDFLKRA
jgi:hypothetical protein